MAEFDEYLENSRKYWSQALETLEKGELEKAGEFVWGSVAARIKALALAETGTRIRSHKGIRAFIKRVSYDMGDAEMYRTYREVESLHSNFYESDMDAEDVKDIMLRAYELILDIDRLMRA